MRTDIFRILGMCLAFGILSPALAPAGAQTRQKLSFSLEEAQQYAVEHNRTLANASLDIQKAQASRWQAIASMLPQISANGTYSNNLGYKMDFG